MATTLAANSVDTAHVSGRRTVQYHSHEEVLADLERIAARGYQQLGNWSLGQIAKHQSVAMTTAVDGFPGRVAWPIRAFAQLFIKRKVLNEPMRAGVKLPAKFAKVLVPDTTGDAEGIDALRTATHRLQTEPQRHPHGFFGKLSSAEWDKLLLNHAAMHMSFLIPK
jgi:hypothetical protein